MRNKIKIEKTERLIEMFELRLDELEESIRKQHDNGVKRVMQSTYTLNKNYLITARKDLARLLLNQ
jgi:hypothetical protein